MLKVNVGLSRKLTQDYNSTGFSVNIEGEVTAPPNDAESVIHGIKELYDLAEEALDLQVERHRSDSAIASRDEPQRQSSDRHNGYSSNGHGSSNGNGTTNGSRQPYRESSNNGSRSRWTLKLLADRLVALEVVDSISRECVRSTLKKTSSSLI